MTAASTGPIISREAFNLHQEGFRAEGDAVYLSGSRNAFAIR